MEYINLPESMPAHMQHKVFYSKLYGHKVGYCIYVPADYEKSSKAYPIHYHFHGWQGDESSCIWAMEPVYKGSEHIFVFPNISDELGEAKALPVEQMFFEELMPEIESNYRVSGERTLSGFSMGGGMAVWYALRHPGLFARVIAYAGTFHHYYHKDYMTAFVPAEQAAALYEGMLQANWGTARNLLAAFTNAPKDIFTLDMRIGTKDPLYCDAEVLHMHLKALGFPHSYRVIEGAEHHLSQIV